MVRLAWIIQDPVGTAGGPRRPFQARMAFDVFNLKNHKQIFSGAHNVFFQSLLFYMGLKHYLLLIYSSLL